MRARPVMHTVIRVALLLVAGVVVGVNAYMWNSRYVLGDELPMPFGYGLAVVSSGSMEPALSVDDLVLIAACAGSDAAVGDVIVYQRASDLIIHRVVAVADDELTLQGDANNTPDEPVAFDAVKGRLVASVPGAGAFVSALRSPIVSLLVIVVAFALVEVIYKREGRSRQEEVQQLQAQIQQLKVGQCDGGEPRDGLLDEQRCGQSVAQHSGRYEEDGCSNAV